MTPRITPGPLVIATHNQGKFREFKSLLEPLGFTLTCNADHNLPEPEETETTFEGNALIKARAAAAALNIPALADDSGLTVAALGGDPGVYTADWAETPTGRDYPMAMKKVWDAIQATEQTAPFEAAFNCTLAMAWPDGTHRVFAGVLPGQIIWPARGSQGHGFDPIFAPTGHDISLGEMRPEDKNRLSHRARAVELFIQACDV